MRPMENITTWLRQPRVLPTGVPQLWYYTPRYSSFQVFPNTRLHQSLEKTVTLSPHGYPLAVAESMQKSYRCFAQRAPCALSMTIFSSISHIVGWTTKVCFLLAEVAINYQTHHSRVVRS